MGNVIFVVVGLFMLTAIMVIAVLGQQPKSQGQGGQEPQLAGYEEAVALARQIESRIIDDLIGGRLYENWPGSTIYLALGSHVGDSLGIEIELTDQARGRVEPEYTTARGERHAVSISPYIGLAHSFPIRFTREAEGVRVSGRRNLGGAAEPFSVLLPWDACMLTEFPDESTVSGAYVQKMSVSTGFVTLNYLTLEQVFEKMGRGEMWYSDADPFALTIEEPTTQPQ